MILSRIMADFCATDDLIPFVSPGNDDARDVVATRMLQELNGHQDEHREALDHLNGVIPAHEVDGVIDDRAQLSAIREAFGVLAREGVTV